MKSFEEQKEEYIKEMLLNEEALMGFAAGIFSNDEEEKKECRIILSPENEMELEIAKAELSITTNTNELANELLENNVKELPINENAYYRAIVNIIPLLHNKKELDNYLSSFTPEEISKVMYGCVVGSYCDEESDVASYIRSRLNIETNDIEEIIDFGDSIEKAKDVIGSNKFLVHATDITTLDESGRLLEVARNFSEQVMAGVKTKERQI